MVVWHVTTEIMLVIIYLLEDEQELSLGMLIRPNVSIISACCMHVLCDFAMFCLNFHTLLSILTQCTQLPVPVFCCFCILGFPAIKSAPKISEKLYINNRPGNLQNHQGR